MFVRSPLIVCLSALMLVALACGTSTPTPTPPPTLPPQTATPVLGATPVLPTPIPPTPTVILPPTLVIAPTSAGGSSPAPSCLNESDFVADVTIPDRTPMVAGQTFIKTWRLRNSGTCAWDSRYQLVQISGNLLTANPSIIPLPDVAPGAEVDISASLTLAAGAPVGSEQRAQFQIRAPDGTFFGTRPYVLVVVTSPGSPTSTPAGGTASIAGTVWADYCSVPSGGGTPAGNCIPAPGGGFMANGIWDGSEQPIGGVRVGLRQGNCGGSLVATAATQTTGPAQGMYSFTGLAAGNYCVFIDAADATNASILLPGGWSYPGGYFASTIVQQNVTVQAGQYLTNVDFGWDFQMD